MRTNGSSKITRFVVACHERAEILHRVVRKGRDAIYEAIKQISDPAIGELYQAAIDECRRDRMGETALTILAALWNCDRDMLSAAARIADTDPPPTTYQIEWMEPKGRHNAAMENAVPLCPAPQPVLTATTAHSADFRSVIWHGVKYSFTANQSRVVETL